MARVLLSCDLAGVRCVVIGAGRVAERRISLLLRAGARVRVVAPDASARVRALARSGRLAWRRGRYRRGDLRGARLVVAAIADAAVCEEVTREARRVGAFVNRADEGRAGSVWFPAVLRRGPVQIAVSTGGESPGMARALRDRLARLVRAEHGEHARIVGAVRRRLRERVAGRTERERRLRRVLRAPVLRLLQSGRRIEARRVARRAAGLH